MKKYLSIVLIFIAGQAFCQKFIDPAICSYVKEFNKEVEVRGFQISKNITCIKFPNHYEDSVFRFDHYNPSWSGVVVENINNKEKGVFFNAKVWYMSDETGKEMMVFHELFHAYFNIPHSDNEVIMKACPTNAECIYYKNHKKEILDKIFKSIHG